METLEGALDIGSKWQLVCNFIFFISYIRFYLIWMYLLITSKFYECNYKQCESLSVVFQTQSHDFRLNDCCDWSFPQLLYSYLEFRIFHCTKWGTHSAFWININPNLRTGLRVTTVERILCDQLFAFNASSVFEKWIYFTSMYFLRCVEFHWAETLHS